MGWGGGKLVGKAQLDWEGPVEQGVAAVTRTVGSENQGRGGGMKVTAGHKALPEPWLRVPGGWRDPGILGQALQSPLHIVSGLQNMWRTRPPPNPRRRAAIWNAFADTWIVFKLMLFNSLCFPVVVFY